MPSRAEDTPSESGSSLRSSGLETATANSISVAGLTLLSRVIGLGRVAVVAAILGPTFLGNTYQLAVVIPMMTYELTGSLFNTLLVPPLVRYVDAGDRRGVARVAGGFLGVAVLALGALALVAVAIGPWLLKVLSLGIASEAVAADQQRVGWILLCMLMPNVVLYAIVGTSTAVMNAHGRYVLPSVAPILESLAVMTTFGVYAALFGVGTPLESVGTPELLVLGLGTTGAVAVNATAQWLGCRRLGVTLRPRPWWRETEVIELVKRARQSGAQAGLGALRSIGVLIVSNAVPGGVIAFQFALNFVHFPVALLTRPLAFGLLPRLSRLYHDGAAKLFHDEFVRGTALGLFFVVPTAVGFAALSVPIANAVAFGEMASPRGHDLLAVSLAALAPAVLGESSYTLGSYGSYALHDAKAPLRAMVVRTAISAVLIVVALTLFDDLAMLAALGIAVSVGNVVSGWHLIHAVRRRLPRTSEHLLPSVLRSLAVSLVVAAPAFALARFLGDRISGPIADIAIIVAVGLGGMWAFVVVQRALKAPELSLIAAGLAQLRERRRGGEAAEFELAAPRRDRALAGTWTTFVAATALALALGLLAAFSPALAVVGALLVLLVVVVWMYPHVGAYLVIGITPLIVGINRGQLVPVLRPSEALAAVVGICLFARAGYLYARRGEIPFRLGRLDLALVLIPITGSIMPLINMWSRARPITEDDFLYALVPWKLLAIYLMIRLAVRTEAHVRVCLWVSMGAAVIVAVIAIFQALGLFGVTRILETYYAFDGDVGGLYNQKGTSTLSNSFSVADVMIWNLGIAVGLLVRGSDKRILIPLAALFGLTVFSSGQYSGALALVIGCLAIGAVTRRFWTVMGGLVGLVAAAAVLLRPVIANRLSDFEESRTGWPQSWVGRYNNLRTNFWPELASDWNWVFGVRTAARLPTPEYLRLGGLPDRWVWIESGHTWLLWSGGIPYLAAFLFFVYTGLRTMWRIARERMDAIGAAATGSLTALAVIAVMTLFDPHLTGRGVGELTMSLLALASTGLAVREPARAPAPAGARRRIRATPAVRPAGR